MMGRHQTGFTLVELMIVVVILAILLGIAVPSYRSYMMRANRVDATAALLRIAAAQEKFYLQSNPARYATTAVELASPPPAGLGVGTTQHQYYNLAIAAGPNGAASGYLAIALVDGSKNQAADTDCVLFRINERGQHFAQNAVGADTTNTCWR